MDLNGVFRNRKSLNLTTNTAQNRDIQLSKAGKLPRDRRDYISVENTKRIKKNSIVGKQLHLFENQIDGRIRKRLCSAKPAGYGKMSDSFQIAAPTPLNIIEKNFIVNDAEYDRMQLIIKATPRADIVNEFQTRTGMNTDIYSPKQPKDFLYKVKLPQNVIKKFK